MSNKLFDAMESVAYTENGALTYSTSLNHNLDFFALASAKRDDVDDAVKLFVKAYDENPLLAIKNLFYLRDIRNGQGERAVFRACMQHMANDEKMTDVLVKCIRHIPEYGSWKDVFALYTPFSNDKVSKEICRVTKEQLDADIKNAIEDKPISLCAKWFPLANNTKNPQKKSVAKSLCASIFVSNVECRKIISSLRRALNICEQHMSANKWASIDYSKLPSKAGMIHRGAFLKHDESRYTRFLIDVSQGKKRINASTIYPYEIVKKYVNDCVYECCYEGSPQTIEKDETLEQLWRNLPDYCDGKNAICVVDVSGSMLNPMLRPMCTAVSLGIYFAERNNSTFKGKYITFSESPAIQSIDKDASLLDNVKKVMHSNWGMNTDILRVFDLILDSAVSADLKQSDMPETVYIISDMEFDEACDIKKTTFVNIKTKYKKAGYECPQLVFWNVASRNDSVPVRKHTSGTTLVSGLSPIVFKYAVEGKNPEEFMMEVLSSTRYERLNMCV